MTIYAEASCAVRTGLFRHVKKVIARKPLNPGEYEITHDPVYLEVRISRDDSVALSPESVKETEAGVGSMEFAGVDLEIGIRNVTDAVEVSVVPLYGKPVLCLGPDIYGVTLSLVRWPSENYAAGLLGETTFECSIKPKTPGPSV